MRFFAAGSGKKPRAVTAQMCGQQGDDDHGWGSAATAHGVCLLRSCEYLRADKRRRGELGFAGGARFAIAGHDLAARAA